MQEIDREPAYIEREPPVIGAAPREIDLAPAGVEVRAAIGQPRDRIVASNAGFVTRKGAFSSR